MKTVAMRKVALSAG